MDGDVDDKAESHKVSKNRGTTVAKKWQSDAGNRHSSHGHGNIFENLEGKHSNDTDDDESSKGVFAVFGNFHHGVNQEGICCNDNSATKEPQFLYNNREDKIGIANRQEF